VATFPWTAFPTITTARLRLREIAPADAEDLFRFRSDAEVQRYNIRPMRSVREAEMLVSTMQHWYRTAQAVQWGITLLGDHRVVGICGLHDWYPTHRRAMLGYDLVREHWGKRLAQEAMRDVLRLGFETLALNRIEAITVVDNGRSVRLLERLGFRREGVRREHSMEDDGAYHGSAIYGLLRSEYAEQARRTDNPPMAAPAP